MDRMPGKHANRKLTHYRTLHSLSAGCLMWRGRLSRLRSRVFGSAHAIDGFWVHLRAAQLSTAANPAEGPPVTPRIIISDQAAAVGDSQHRSAVVHVHRSHRVC